MRIESFRQQFLAKVADRLDRSTDDVVSQAKRNLGGGGALTGSVKVERIGQTRWRVGSNHPGARAQELGAYVRPRAKRALKFNGRWAMHARIPAKRWLTRAGRQWPDFAARHLRGG